MVRPSLPFAAQDMSALARSLRTQLAGCDHLPGHVEMLNMLARATGHRNFQHFRAQASAAEQLATPAQPAEPVNPTRLARVARLFDGDGRLIRWPGKASLRALCMWGLWAELPAGETLSEKQVNARLEAFHLFGDYALLRRWLCDNGLLFRTADGRIYRRIEQRPPAEARALIRHLRTRRRPAPSAASRAA